MRPKTMAVTLSLSVLWLLVFGMALFFVIAVRSFPGGVEVRNPLPPTLTFRIGYLRAEDLDRVEALHAVDQFAERVDPEVVFLSPGDRAVVFWGPEKKTRDFVKFVYPVGLPRFCGLRVSHFVEITPTKIDLAIEQQLREHIFWFCFFGAVALLETVVVLRHRPKSNSS